MKIKKKRRKPPAAARAAQAALQTPMSDTGATEASTSAAKKAPSQYKSVDATIKTGLIPYQVWKEWQRARARCDYPFLYDISHPDGPLRESFGDRDEFPEVVRRKLRPLCGIHDADLVRIRLDNADTVHLFQVIGADDRARRDVTVERWVLLRDETPWRVYQIDRIERPKEESIKELKPALFPDVELPDGFCERVAEREKKRLEELRIRRLNRNKAPEDDGIELATE